MKERIVIDQDWLVKDMKAGVVETDKLFICQKVEQVPETFADVYKLLVDKLQELKIVWYGDKFIDNKNEEFWVKGVLFSADKTLSIRDNNDKIRVIMANIDYPLMWQLIKTTLSIKK